MMRRVSDANERRQGRSLMTVMASSFQRDVRAGSRHGLARLAASENTAQARDRIDTERAPQHPASAAADASSAGAPAGSPSDTAHVITPFRNAAVTTPRAES